LPAVDLDALRKAFAVDVETCTSIAERMDQGREAVALNLPKFLAEQ